MQFNSVIFGVFFTIVFFVYWALPEKHRAYFLLLSSYYFYMSWDAKYVLIILLTTCLSYSAAIAIEKQESKKTRKTILIVTIIILLGFLIFFKYANFVLDTIGCILSIVSIPIHPIVVKVLLPVGISFYTFQTLSYVIDVYNDRVRAERNFIEYAAFISFFPQLVAGPIERTDNLLPQIKKEKKFDYKRATYGIKLMAWGFFKKLAIADVLAVYVDKVYDSPLNYSGLEILMAILFFTIQIYCDFSGYSDIAIGSAKMLGVNLMTNFRSPYLSTSIKEFWSRWHISLSTWFRDYVYIPLGGNRCSKAKNALNLLITFLISGLWHGANWTFVLWGGVHGVAQIIENFVHRWHKEGILKSRTIKWMFTFLFCNITWILFRAESLDEVKMIIRGFTSPAAYRGVLLAGPFGIDMIHWGMILLPIAILGIYDFAADKHDVIAWISEKGIIFRWIVYLLIIWMVLSFMLPSGGSEFVYFQF